MTFRSPNDRVDAFLREVIDLCKKHGFSISHEDRHGAFEIVEYSDSDARWLLAADRDKLPREPELKAIIAYGVNQ